MIKLLVLLAMLLGGCAGQPGGNWIGVNTPGDIGELPDNYKDVASDAVRVGLLDPYSAMIEVYDGYQSSCAIGVYGTFHGWAVPMTVNAKNAFGGYTGTRAVFVWFANGVPQRVSAAPGWCP